MQHSPQERLHLISHLIDQEQERAMDALVASLAADMMGQKSDYDGFSATRQEKNALLSLQCLRINYLLISDHIDGRRTREQIQEDWKDILDHVKYFSYAWEITGEVVSDALELVLLFQPANRGALCRSIGIRESQIQSGFTRREQVFYIAENMIVYLLEHGFEEESKTFVENLIQLSECQSRHSYRQHRLTVANTLGYIVDLDPIRTGKIALAQAQYFHGITDEVAALFYLRGGYALSRSGKSDAAETFYRRCIDINYFLEGTRSWSAARACLFWHFDKIDAQWNAESDQFLRSFLKNSAENYYIHVDDSAPFLEAHARYVLLSRNMDHGSLRGLLPEIEEFYAYCRDNETHVNNPYLTVRVAENIYSGYYLELGDNLLAAQHEERALLSIPPDGLSQIPSDDLIYANLLNIYSQMNDVDKMDSLVEQLAKKTDIFTNPETFHGSRDEFYRLGVLVLSAYSKLGVPESEHLEDYKRALFDFYHEMSYHTNRWRKEGETDVGYGLFLLACISGIMDCFCSDKTELTQYLLIVEHLLQNQDVYAFRDVQKAMAYLMKADVLWQMEDPRAAYAAQQCLEYCKAFDPSQEALVSMRRLCAVILYNAGQKDLAKTVALDTLQCITASWHKATSYLNDHRVSQVLANIQFYYDVCYAILKQSADFQNRYQQILQFKNLPALVGRERNRVLRLSPVDKNLIRQIYLLQDQIATAQIDDAINETNRSAELLSRLQGIEAEFAASFPQNVQFTDITVARVADRLQEQEAILEYFFSLGSNALKGGLSESNDLELEIFAITKKDGKATIHYACQSNGYQILDAANTLIGYYQRKTHGDDADMASLKAQLYRWLIKPLHHHLQAVKTLYLAPDLALCNLPIENLFGDGSSTFFEEHRICRIVCGRDLLFCKNGESTARNNVVLGDPDYDYYRSWESDTERRVENNELAKPIPFSKLEAYTVSRLCGCSPLTGKLATKYALQANLPCRIIHLATHGVVDIEMESDSLYSSALLFAGYNTWIADGIEMESCGNGILTADEISRMDLRQTELVVLSACQSGLGDTMFGSVQGLVSAFSAAGVKWVICHLWEADDCASSILMGMFYREYLLLHKNVPDALQAAKTNLQNANIQQLQQQGWLDLPKGVQFAKTVTNYFNELKLSNPRKKQFNSEHLWGGFVCYQCN